MHGFLPLTRFIKLRDKICSLAFAMQQTAQIVGASNRDSLILTVSRAAVWLPLCGLTRAHPCSCMRVADGFAGAEGPGCPLMLAVGVPVSSDAMICLHGSSHPPLG